MVNDNATSKLPFNWTILVAMVTPESIITVKGVQWPTASLNQDIRIQLFSLGKLESPSTMARQEDNLLCWNQKENTWNKHME